MKIKLLNLNLWLLPPPFSIHNKKRLSKLVNLIKQLNPDIITLQEVWLSKYLRYLKEKLPKYDLIAFNTGFFNKSGLVTLTRIKTIQKEMHYFAHTKKHSFIEKIAAKGYQKLKFELKNKKISLINCHLYSPNHKHSEKITINQFNRIKSITKEDDFIVLGDLNLNVKTFNSINKKHFKHDGNNGHTRIYENEYQKARFNSSVKSNVKEDYILFKFKPKKVSIINSEIIKEPLLSDHLAIFTEIKIK